MHTSETEVRALLEARVECSRDKDVERLMSLFSPDIVYVDVVPPLRITGRDTVRANFERWFGEYEGPIDLETHDLTVEAGEDAAYAHMVHRDTGTLKDGTVRSVLVRSTVCLRRIEGAWLITHEHVSVPIDPATMRAWQPQE